MMMTLFGNITSNETTAVDLAPPLATTRKETSKIPSFDVSKVIFRHPSNELGDEHSGCVTRKLELVAQQLWIGHSLVSVEKLFI